MPKTYQALREFKCDSFLKRANCIDEIKSNDFTFWRCLAIGCMRDPLPKGKNLSRTIARPTRQLELAKQIAQQPVEQPVQQIKRKNTRSVKQKKEFKSPPVIYEDNEEINNEVHIQEYEGGNKMELLSDDEENDSDLDAELHEELNELGTNNSLKKEQ